MLDSIPLIVSSIIAVLWGRHGPSVIAGSLAGSAALSYQRALLIIALGLLIGTIFEGVKMDNSLIGGVAKIGQDSGIQLSRVAFSTLITIAAVLVILLLIRVPISISNIAVGSFLGASIRLQLEIDWSFTTLIFTSWMVLPLLAALVTVPLYTLMRRVVSRLSLIRVDILNRFSVLFVSIYLSYVIGANNVGLINGLILPLVGDSSTPTIVVRMFLPIFTSLGVILLGRGTAETSGEELVVLSPMGVVTSMFSVALILWSFTQAGVPVSTTQALVGSIIGAALSRRLALYNKRILSHVLIGWVAATVAGFAIAYSVTDLLYI